MKTEKFVLIDSNIYISLCFFDLDITNVGVLEKLGELLDQKKFYLLLPEVVELEFERKFNEKISFIETAIKQLIETINKSKDIGSNKAKQNLIKSIKDSRSVTLSDIQKIKEEVNGIFLNKNTIRDGLKLTPEILVDGYKTFLKREKPYKNVIDEKRKYDNIQPDTLIIASAVNYLATFDKYKLYFSTGNPEDFCEDSSVKDKSKLELSVNIKSQFEHIRYYYDPLEMLNENFGASYTKKIIDEFEVKRKQDSNYLSASLISTFAVPPGGDLIIDSAQINALNSLRVGGIPGTISSYNIRNGLTGLNVGLNTHQCSKCGNVFQQPDNLINATSMRSGFQCPVCGNFDII
ncbi:MAG: hypothetical protein A3G52_00995 [Candidatus Taylorbacteria bacterium RIFCSPLOWO2_12_FULL_43_20]|uniref:DUF4935 domain-containing protein n=2 Tax=Parcubacteria group TaxID=1794811 RepID=A0A1F7URJ7_9BACT|nr:MAG: hypothetical protein UX68_C0015G0011 [Parcubacteria group bacterium GW2011_GWA2_46_9]OGL59889.1 MAG: hypothetical protein A2752_04075 [Candidatus Uhrbacteria bacterium RIFCSPHIGHO2_01_FULL_46_23]OGL69440.1 MAG: hypothetical protein A3D60_03145 [Candidatus Uhrbacteria bacterium RIFCSPHIGHO2_02_FULL_47_29]OGL75352.1 MAG: hypothetical protein A3E96_02465 [Candidatus Uhrbacteria bacterium RIFCSPHIGHO2_12_FULL_46_13]OGL80896.1 MAG: hypothetical protein A2936_05710 [Candidatus Uhrbacteria bac